MELNLDSNVRPFFQVLVNKVDIEISAQYFFRKFRRILSEKSNHSSKHYYRIIQPKEKEIEENHFFSACVEHSQVPTWYKSDEKIDLSTSKRDVLLDVEYDIVVFYRKDDYLFLHTNCQQILSLLQNTIDEIKTDDGIKFKRLLGSQLNLILNLFNVEYRSLGIQNHFGCGGTAPDAKTYYSRDASASLTPSFDAGYGFSYCIASMEFEDNTRTPFGCSKTKSKIWTTWVNDLDAFCDQCDKIIKWLNSEVSEFNKLDVLVQSVNTDVIDGLEPLEFFLDYFIPEKGPLSLGREDFTLDWTCKYDQEGNVIEFTFKDENEEITVLVKFEFDSDEGTYSFSYDDEDNTVNVSLSEIADDAKTPRSTDLVAFLSKQHHFTILYNEPYSYRGEECWEDNRLTRVFSNTSDEIDWSDVDLKKENLRASPGQMNILEKIDEYFKGQEEFNFCCIDNGANEIADYIAFSDKRIVLIHAKYASDQIPKLLIGDIQVVASQAVKNTRFFLPAAYNDTIINRLFEKATKKDGLDDVEAFRKQFFKTLSNHDIERECWIVQPGISIPELKRDETNKMHTILNFLDSILKVNNVKFKLVANAAKARVRKIK